MHKLKIMAILGFMFLIISLLLLHNSPAKGYEISIYSATPLVAWILLILSVCIGLFIIVRQAFAREEGNTWVLGFVLLAISMFTIFILPPLRGYINYLGGDPVFHFSEASQIVNIGYVSEGNLYPFTHVLVAQISLISGTDPSWGLKILEPFISLIYAASTYLLARAALSERKQALLALVASVIPCYGLLHVSLYPNGLALLLVPLVFYLYFRGLERPSVPDRVLLIMLLMLYPFMYAPVSIVVTLCLAASEVIRWILGKRVGSLSPHTGSTISMNPALISFIMVFLWSSSFIMFDISIVNAWSWLHGQIVSLPLVDMSAQMLLPLGLQELAALALKMYGENLALILLSLVAAVIIVRRVRRGDYEAAKLLLVGGLIIVSLATSVMLFMVTTRISVGRFLSLNYAMWPMPVMVGFVLYLFFPKRSGLRIALVTAILAIMLVFSIAGIYSSPYINQPSPQLTRTDINGNDWVAEHAVPLYALTTMGYDPNDAHDLTGYKRVTPKGKPIYVYYPNYAEKEGIPDHFGYPEHVTLADSVSERFLVITRHYQLVSSLLNQPDNTMYSSVEFGRIGFNESDFERLELDPSLDKLYSSKEVNVWYVNPLK